MKIRKVRGSIPTENHGIIAFVMEPVGLFWLFILLVAVGCAWEMMYKAYP